MAAEAKAELAPAAAVVAELLTTTKQPKNQPKQNAHPLLPGRTSTSETSGLGGATLAEVVVVAMETAAAVVPVAAEEEAFLDRQHSTTPTC